MENKILECLESQDFLSAAKLANELIMNLYNKEYKTEIKEDDSPVTEADLKANEIIIKNSRFICVLMKINSTDISNILDRIKEEYPKATHYCYAYVYNDVQRFSDDGEPGGTAGVPIMEVLLKNDLNYILCVVVRYFGGIKLGAGGLVRAYSTAASMSLNEAKKVTYEDYCEIEIICSYSDYGKINILLQQYDVIIDSSDFADEIKIRFAVREDISKELTDKIVDTFNGRITPNCIGKRIDCK